MMMRPPLFMYFSAACVAASVPRTLIVDDAIHLLERGLLEPFRNGCARIVHEHIKSAEGCEGLFDAPLDGSDVGSVRLDRDSLTSVEFDRFDYGGSRAGVLRNFGRLDVLVNNAGTAIPKRFEETTLEEMDRVIDINVRGTLAATQAALKYMKSGGRIIMTGSAVGERVLTPGLVCLLGYQGSRKDVFAQGLSREVGSRGITVNNVQPGPIDTDLNPAAGDWAVPQKAATALDRYGHVDEVAALVAFVAGPESSYITGANLTVDGGMNA